LTVTPDWIKGVTTMKMINITNIMSTIGVTLISEFKLLALWLPLPFVLMALSPSGILAI
jgi:hypothetical protein